jgi:glycosyltransferase involved in cell wall biosynthesis
LKNIIFIGSFNESSNNNVIGGQLFACKSLIESDLSNKYNFFLVDTTMKSLPPPSIPFRFYYAFKRNIKILLLIINNNIDSCLIFTSGGLSFKEKGIIVLICKLFKIKAILFPRSGLIINDFNKNIFNKIFIKYIIQKSDIVLCQTKSWVEYYSILDCNKSKFTLIHNWIDLKKYKTSKTRKHQTIPINILYLGWLEIYKGIYDILDAIKILENKSDKLKFYIYGRGRQENSVIEYIRVNNISVNLCGLIQGNKKYEMLSNMDIYVHPSHAEGFPNSILEAMASKIPTISTNLKSIQDIIINDYNGILYEVGNNEELANKIYQLSTDHELRNKISSNAYQHLIENHSLDITVAKFEKIL